MYSGDHSTLTSKALGNDVNRTFHFEMKGILLTCLLDSTTTYTTSTSSHIRTHIHADAAAHKEDGHKLRVHACAAPSSRYLPARLA